MAHTPGPWQMWTSCSFRRISSQRGGDGDVLCAVVQHSDGHPDLYFKNGGFDGPDARLILAAPDLLAALQALVAADEEQGLDDKLFDAARAAVAAATGDAS